MAPAPTSSGIVGSAARALFAPWSFTNDSPAISTTAALLVGALYVVVAAGLSTYLSTWTYLVGKGLLMAAKEMDMGMDDLPADSVRQVVGSFVASIGIWTALLALIYFVGVDEGAASLVPGHYVHEWVHDGRHLLGFPCH